MIEPTRAPLSAPAGAGARVLVVEDDADLGALVASVLAEEGYETHVVTDPRHALEAFERIRPDVVTLDVMMPGIDGLTLCLEMRRITDVPVLFISAKQEPPDRTVALRLGADDYIGKPFDTEELVARVNALMRRAGSVREPRSTRELRFGSFLIDLGRVRAVAGDETVPLTATEFKLLRALASEPGRVLTREDLLTSVWGYERGSATRLVDVHVGRLRRKLERARASEVSIETARGFGYRLVDRTRAD